MSLGVSGAEVLLAVVGEEPFHAGNPGAEQLVERIVTSGLFGSGERERNLKAFFNAIKLNLKLRL